MSLGREKRSVYEYEPIREEQLIREIEDLADRFYSLKKCLVLHRQEIRFRHYTGIIQTQSYQIDVLPKVWNNRKINDEENRNIASRNFMKLFSYSLPKEKLFEHGAELSKLPESNGMIDFLVNLYSLSLKREIERGIFREYKKEETESRFLNGKLNIKEQVMSADKSKFHVSRFLLTSENELNRFFSYSTNVFSLATSNVSIRSSLASIALKLKQELDVQLSPLIREVTFNRLNDRFEAAYNYARIVMDKLTPHSAFDLSSMMFIFDMNYVFESFVYNFLVENKTSIFDDPESVDIRFQLSSKNFIHSDSYHRFTRPDITVVIDGETALIIDAKYKLIEENNVLEDQEETVSEIEQVSSNDFYQMYAYSRVHNSDVLMVFPSSRNSKMVGPYTFLGPTDDKRIWISWWSLDFSIASWDETLTKQLKKSLSRILESTKT